MIIWKKKLLHHAIMYLLIITGLSTNIFAEWQVISPKESGRLLELDTKRSKKVVNNYIAFARAYSSDQRIEFKTEINCTKKKHKLLFQYVTDNKGRVIHESSKSSPWESIAQGSIFEVLMQHFCHVKPD